MAGFGFGFGSRSVGIGSGTGSPPPTLAAPTITMGAITGTPEDGETLSVTWTEGGSVTTRQISWTRNGAHIEGSEVWNGEQPATFTLDAATHGFQIGDNIGVTVNLSGPGGSTGWVAAAPVVFDDTIAPTLSAATFTKTGANSATAGFTTDDSGGTAWRYISESATPPAAVDHTVGEGAVEFAEIAIEAAGAHSATLIDLPFGTTLYVHYRHADVAGNMSAPVTAGPITTSAEVLEPWAANPALVGWFAPGDPDNVTASGGRVQTLTNKTGAGTDLDNTLTTKLPQASTAVFGGRGSALFTRQAAPSPVPADVEVLAANTLGTGALNSVVLGADAQHTVIYVIHPIEATTGLVAGWSETNGTTDRWEYIVRRSGTNSSWRNGTSGQDLSLGILAENQTYIIALKRDATTESVWINDTAKFSETAKRVPGFSFVTPRFLIGSTIVNSDDSVAATLAFGGHVGEVLTFGPGVTDAEIQEYITYLASTHGVTIVPTLAALSLSTASVPEDAAATINIVGATAGSTITIATGALPAGMTLDSAARTITGTPTTPETANFTLSETLAGATGSPLDTPLTITVTEVVGGTLMSSASQDGIGWAFNQPAQVGTYADSSYQALGPVSITQITPVSDQYKPDYLEGGVISAWVNGSRVYDSPAWMHGTMVNPGNRSFTGGSTANNQDDPNQGITSITSKLNPDGTNAVSGSDKAYTHSFNKNPGATGTALVVTEGTVFSTASRDGRNGRNLPQASGKPGGDYAAALTVVTALAPPGSLRPGKSCASKTSYFHEDDWDVTIFDNFPKVVDPSTGSAPSASSLIAGMTDFPGTSSGYVDFVHTATTRTPGQGYPRWTGWAVGDLVCALHQAYTETEKRQMLTALAGPAFDMHERWMEGANPSGNGSDGALNGANGVPIRKVALGVVIAALHAANTLPGAQTKLAEMRTMYSTQNRWTEDKMMHVVPLEWHLLPRMYDTSRPRDPYSWWMVGSIDHNAGSGGSEADTAAGANWDVVYRLINNNSNLHGMAALARIDGAIALWNWDPIWEYQKIILDTEKRLDRWGGSGPGTEKINAYRRELIDLLWPADPTIPTLASATVDGTNFRMVFSKALDEAAVVDLADYTVNVNGTPVIGLARGVYGPPGAPPNDEWTYELRNTAPNGIFRTNVGLELPFAVTLADTVTVSYVGGTGANKLRSAVDNVPVEAFTDFAVNNNTGGLNTPVPNASIQTLANAGGQVLKYGSSPQSEMADWFIVSLDLNLPTAHFPTNATLTSNANRSTGNFGFYAVNSTGGMRAHHHMGAYISYSSFFNSGSLGKDFTVTYFVDRIGGVIRLFAVRRWSDGVNYSILGSGAPSQSGLPSGQMNLANMFNNSMHLLGTDFGDPARVSGIRKVLMAYGTGAGPTLPAVLSDNPSFTPGADWGARGETFLANLGIPDTIAQGYWPMTLAEANDQAAGVPNRGSKVLWTMKPQYSDRSFTLAP